ncbi:MAG TPA: NCS2 family permease, partial [candidate division Zixibacteria bacterium]|nr:NCS2 family permease [candidate division Zixibacteria bacterium]
FIFLYMDMFDTVGTLLAVAEAGNLMTPDGRIVRGNRALISDAVGTIVGALFGTSTVTSYIESTAGITAGARRGIAAVVVAVLFVLSLFFYPLIKMIGAGIQVGDKIFHPITAPALIVVGAMMTTSLAKIDWSKKWEVIPAFITIIGIPLTYSIADGFALGFVSYVISGVAAGKKIPVAMWIIAALFVLRYILV